MMARGESWKREWHFFINPKTGKVQYNRKCLSCIHDCKQSHKCKVVYCPAYEKKSEDAGSIHRTSNIKHK